MASKRQLSVGRPVMWVGIAVLSAGLAVGAWFLKTSGVEAGVKAANRHAASDVKKHLARNLTEADVREPMTEEESDALQRVVAGEILDEHTSTVRIWSPEGVMLYSSTGEATGGRGGNERGIRVATTGDGKTTSTVPASEGGDLDIYTPLRVGADDRPAAAVEVVESFAPIVEAAGQPWSLVQSGAGGLAAIALLMVVVSFAFLRAGRFGKREGWGSRAPAERTATSS